MINAFITLILSFLSGLFYRYGGSANGVRWVREVGVGLCILIELMFLNIFSIPSILCMGSVWIESTYFKKKLTEATWLNWLLVGLSFSVSLLPWFITNWLISGSPNIGFMVRIPLCAGYTVLWQEVISNDIAIIFKTTKDITDEFGRGFIQVATLPLLLMGA